MQTKIIADENYFFAQNKIFIFRKQKIQKETITY